MFSPHLAAGLSLALLLIALAGYVTALKTRSGVNKTLVIVLACAGMAIAVAIPPRGSQDLWSYAMYGRMVSHYDQSPYTHAPQEHPEDPLTKRIPLGWQHVNSVYGPLFTAISAGLAAASGSSILPTRLSQQGLELLAAVACMAMVARARPTAHPWLLLGLNPAIIATVNGGHNDLLMGALVAASVLLATKRYLLLAALVMSAAVLIKATAALAAVVLAVWIFKRWPQRIAAFVIPLGAFVIAGYAGGGGLDAVRPLFRNAGYTSRASLLAVPHHFLGHPATTVLSVLVFGSLIWFWLIAGDKNRRIDDAAKFVSLGNCALIFASPYVLPWYSSWVLAAAALSEDTFAGTVAIVQSSVLLAAYAVPAGDRTGALVGTVSICALPAGLLYATGLRLRLRTLRRYS